MSLAIEINLWDTDTNSEDLEHQMAFMTVISNNSEILRQRGACVIIACYSKALLSQCGLCQDK